MDNLVNEPYVKFYSDSYGRQEFFKCDLLTCENNEHADTLICSPHRVVLPNDTKFSIRWDNKAYPGMSMQGFLRGKEMELCEWAKVCLFVCLFIYYNLQSHTLLLELL